MPFKMRKAPKRDLYWVINKETGHKYSKEPLPKENAMAQMRALYANEPKIGGATQRQKDDLVSKMNAVKTKTELLRVYGLYSPLEVGAWFALHPDISDLGYTQLVTLFNDFMTSLDPSVNRIQPSKRVYVPPKPPTVVEKNYKVVINHKPRAQKSVNYNINELRKVTSAFKHGFASDGTGIIYDYWQPDSYSLRDEIKKELEKKTREAKALYYQVRTVTMDGKTNGRIKEGPIRGIYEEKDLNEYIGKTPLRDGGNKRKRGGATTPTKNTLQQMAVASYTTNPPETIGAFKLVKHTATLKFYYDEAKRLMIVAIRGTKLTDKHDIIADALAVSGNLKNSYRYNNDLHQLREVKKEYPHAVFFGVAHSLGGAILDLFLRNRLISAGLSYNGFPEPQERQGNPLHHRIYHTGDFIYKIFANKIPNTELRTTSEPFWKYLLKYSMPVDVFTGIDRHLLDRFKGGILL
jgi:hypothetical protein